MLDLVNNFDSEFILWLNVIASGNDFVDHFVWKFANSDLIKGGVMVGLLWGVWTLDRPSRDATSDMVRAFLGLVAAVFICRALQLLTPQRERPLDALALNFRPPSDVPTNALDNWSAFPSDHGVLYVGIAVAVYWRSRIVGALALAWAVVVIFLPRLYSGVHYPSDIIVGAVLGAALMAAAMTVPAPAPALAALGRWRARHPAQFQTLAFIASFEVAWQFRGARFIVDILGYCLGVNL